MFPMRCGSSCRKCFGAVDSRKTHPGQRSRRLRRRADRAAGTVGAAFHDRPIVQSEVRYMMADVPFELGRLRTPRSNSP